MAAILSGELASMAELLAGGRGEFTIWLDGRKVFDKGRADFPDERTVLAAVRARPKP